ncbi:MAG: hypothetical protein QHH15_07450, partial [Candidatus Thermoplasmatota archaeon]|nr:hypothetical protein [Candidatus Thermoplasmatota archaeon]
LTIFAFIISSILPQVAAITPIQSKNKINIFYKTYSSGLSAEPIVFMKPVLKKMYIGDKAEISLNINKTIILDQSLFKFKQNYKVN